MRLLFTVCGRAGSKGVKNKNLKDYLGAPLVYYTLAAIVEYKKYLSKDDIVDVALSTDSEELTKLVCAQNALPVFAIHRVAELSGDSVPKVAVIKDCLARSEKNYNCQYDIVVDLDITSPMRTADDIDQAVQTKRLRPDADAVYSVTTARRNPYFNMVKEDGRFSVPVVKSKYTARQQAPVIYDMNASIYAYSPVALKQKPDVGFFSSYCCFIVMKDTAVLDIDSEEDFELMQVIGAHFFKTMEVYSVIQNTARSL